MADSGLGETNSDAARRVSSRSEPQQERSRLRRTMLVDAAEAIVTETGMDGLRMREVARRAGPADRLGLSLFPLDGGHHPGVVGPQL